MLRCCLNWDMQQLAWAEGLSWRFSSAADSRTARRTTQRASKRILRTAVHSRRLNGMLLASRRKRARSSLAAGTALGL